VVKKGYLKLFGQFNYLVKWSSCWSAWKLLGKD